MMKMEVMMKIEVGPEPLIGKHCLVLADSAWGNGSAIIMTPYTALQCKPVDKCC